MLDRTALQPRPNALVGALLASACLLVGPATNALAAPSASSATTGSGSAALALGGGGKAARSLAATGVKTGAIAPAKKRGKRLILPVQSVTVGKSATVTLRGGLSFKAGKRSLKLRAVRVELTAKRAIVSATVGKPRVAFFVAELPKGKAKLDRAKVTATLAAAKLTLTAKGAAQLRTRLGVDGIPAGLLGRLGVTAKPKSATGGNGGTPGSGGPGAGTPQAGPIKNEPPILARPPGAVDVTGATLTWRPRESWIQYINTGEGTSAIGGAAGGPTEVKPGSSVPLVYSFHGFPFKSGWYDAASGQAAIYFLGGVGFRYSGHGINFSTSNPEIEINGAASRAIFTFNGTEGTRYDNQRGVLVDLHPASIQTPPGGQVDYLDVPATIPADTGASVFAGLYSANTGFGTLSVSFTTPGP